jgi:hypothetical protein
MQISRGLILAGMGVAVVLLSSDAGAQTPTKLNTIADIFASIRGCWKAPKISDPVDLTVRISFTRDGKIFGNARVTYENRSISAEERLLVRIAVMNTFKRCTPFSFSPDLGDAVAGKPFNFHFKSNSDSGA